MSENMRLDTTDTKRAEYMAWAALLLILALTAWIRFNLLDVPLERDEGEYAYAGQLILKGIPPFSEVYNMKLPGIYVIYALIISLFGESVRGIHLGLLAANGATTTLLFMLGKRLYNPLVGAVAAGCFAVLSLGGSVQGVFANAEHFVIPFAVGGALLLLRAADTDKPLLFFPSGVLLGIGFIIKQHGVVFIAFGGIFLLWHILTEDRRDVRRGGFKLLSFCTGAILPFALTCLFFYLAGIFDKFWFWTFVYAREYVSGVGGSINFSHLKSILKSITGSSPLIWIAALVGLAALVWDARTRTRSVFTGLLLGFSAVAVSLGFYFRPHYFVLLLPAASLLAGIGIGTARRLSGRLGGGGALKLIPVLIAVVVLAHTLYHQRSYLFEANPNNLSRMIYGTNPFPESIEIAEFIKRRSDPDDRIAVIGSEPQIYFYSGLRSASGYIYTYALMEAHEYASHMQREMIAEIETAEPRFMVFVNVYTSWLGTKRSDPTILNWYEEYKLKHFKLVGMADILSATDTRYYWDSDAAGYTPRSNTWLAIYERVDSGEKNGPA